MSWALPGAAAWVERWGGLGLGERVGWASVSPAASFRLRNAREGSALAAAGNPRREARLGALCEAPRPSWENLRVRILCGKVVRVKSHCTFRFYLAVDERLSVGILLFVVAHTLRKDTFRGIYFQGCIFSRNLGVCGLQNIR